ncbi:hypothetical protein CJF42_11770 [Pseudoalteromonas sp. NBT06-2]|nr:hypothetical protein CJF42_11770 [Pseudoalteromonas sp. NBT06-2]
MDFIIVFVLLVCVLALVVFSYRFYMLEEKIKIPQRHLERMTEESINKLCDVLKDKGVSEELLISVRESRNLTSASNLVVNSDVPSRTLVDLIRGAEELIQRQEETGEDLSVAISMLLSQARAL